MPDQVEREIIDDGVVSQDTTRVTSPQKVVPKGDTAYTVSNIVWFIGGVLLVILAFRFLLALLGANPTNEFANFIYSISYPFADPFFGLFGYNIHYGVSEFELSTLVAMAVYALIAYGLARLVNIRHIR